MSNLISGDFPTKTYRNINTQSTGVMIKAAKGQVFAVNIYNNATSARYVKLYDAASTPDNTFTPLATIGVPASASSMVTFGTAGQEYLTGIAIRATTGVADNDNTAPSANDVVVNIGWL